MIPSISQAKSIKKRGLAQPKSGALVKLRIKAQRKFLVGKF